VSPANHQSVWVAPSSQRLRLSPNVAVLGVVSLLMGMSSAMIYGLLPVFLVTVLGAGVASVGLIEGVAEATTSLIKIFSGVVSDWIGRRKPLVVLGYALSAVNKILFPLAESASTVLLARICDRIGKGIRDAPRDAFLADVMPPPVRGTGFGLRLALYTIGAVAGPLAAVALMRLSGDDFRLVFWIALIPGFASVAVLLVWVNEPPNGGDGGWRLLIRRADLAQFTAPFWWAIAIAGIFSLARFSPAFLVLKTHDIGVDAAFVPIILVVMYLVYSAAAYPFGILADRIDRHLQLALGATLLISADVVLASAGSIWTAGLGAALWGLQMGVTQGLLAAAVADAAPERLRGTAFGLFDVVVGLATFTASAGAGVIWTFRGAAGSFVAGAVLAIIATAALTLRFITKRDHPRQSDPISSCHQ
jgi:MFS family permease